MLLAIKTGSIGKRCCGGSVVVVARSAANNNRAENSLLLRRCCRWTTKSHMFAILSRRAMQKVSPYAATSSYEEAIRSLNSLQSNAAYISAARLNNSTTQNTNLQDTKKYLLRSGLSLEQVERLSVIHVAGTKGKGSTCAFAEAILREHGFKTGFYSSPHLITVRERFRIDGRPINEHEFARHFWHVYDRLSQLREHERDMPQYFKFLTVLMFHVFCKANVDVAILEVGIGGEHDCTNILGNTCCTGITSLGIDHTSLLGDTIEAIAWQKAGIFKPNAAAFTVEQSNNDAMRVLEARARERKCQLSVVPALESYPWRKGQLPVLGIQSEVQRSNASLAIQLAQAWFSRTQVGAAKRHHQSSAVLSSTENKLDAKTKDCGRYIVTPEHAAPKRTSLSWTKIAAALEACRWPGRTQILTGRTLDFYVDGAHTEESMDSCVAWFRRIVASPRKERRRYLIFNATGDRDSAKLLAPLKTLNFYRAIFVPNLAGLVHNADQENHNFPLAKQLERCRKNSEVWGENSVVKESVYEALNYIKTESEAAGLIPDDDNDNDDDECKPQVLVTGSLHLVGALLTVVDPEFTMTSTF
ncbi:hypothetical protein TKK_0018044 [Trichogramma kaykai]